MTETPLKKFKLTVNFLGYWFISSGLEKGAYSDEMILRDADGFPFVPGKTLNGVFREAFRVAGNAGWFDDFDTETPDKSKFRHRLIQTVFGHDGRKEGFSEDELHTEGLIHFTNAVLPAEVKNEIRSSEEFGDMREFLFTTVQSTAIDNANGTARNQSLRTNEVAVPMHLMAELSLDPPHQVNNGSQISEKTLEAIADLFPVVSSLITEIGGKRRRGFGRCMWYLGETK